MKLQSKTNLFGFNIPNTVLIAIVIGVVLLFFALYKFLRSIFSKVKGFFGNIFGTTGTDAAEENKQELAKAIAKDPNVQFQMNEGNRIKTEHIFACMDGPGTKTAELISLIKSITGKNQMKAIYTMFGTRSISFFPFISNWIPVAFLTNASMAFTGDLVQCVQEELSDTDFKKVKPYFDMMTYKSTTGN